MMDLRAPAFWYERRFSPLTAALLPLSWVWALAARVRTRVALPYKASIPVVCVGNVTVGGAGKTPAAIALMYAMGAHKPCFLTRGYRGRVKSAALVPADARAEDYGDEAVLLSRHAATIVARKRKGGLKLAEQMGFDLVIADDGFQNPGFFKTRSVLVFDGAVGTGNGACLPAGPMRESLHSALPRADAALIVGDDVTGLRGELFGVPVFTGALETTLRPHGNYVAFAGIGRPQKFFDTLKMAGFALSGALPFPDHHAYTQDDLDHIARLAAHHGAHIITTEKDHVRLPADFAKRVQTLPVSLRIDDMDGLISILRRP
jgi:tetraacyldisaccharide 4'-kinase